MCQRLENTYVVNAFNDLITATHHRQNGKETAFIKVSSDNSGNKYTICISAIACHIIKILKNVQ